MHRLGEGQPHFMCTQGYLAVLCAVAFAFFCLSAFSTYVDQVF